MTAAMRCVGLGVSVGARALLSDVSLEVDEGEWLGVVGPNGAGKSTLLRAIAGLAPATGVVELDARPIGTLTRRERAQRVALVPQTPTVPSGMTVLDYVLLGRTPYLGFFAVEAPADLDITNDVLGSLDLLELASRPIDTLSGGERQRVLVARALAQQSRILLLDEPTTALDIGHQQEVLELIDKLRYERGLAVVSTMHDLTIAAQYPDRLALLSAGRVVTVGTGDEVLTEEHLAEHYGATVRILRDADGIVVIPTHETAVAMTVAPGCTVLLGGARSGKSDLAVRLGRTWAGAVHMVVTAEALDDDMAARIARHRADRPPEWRLTEAPVALEDGLAGVSDGALAIVDCLTLWVANLMGAGLDDAEVMARASAFASVAVSRSGPTIVVTNEVGMGVHPDTDLGRRYRDLLGRVNACVVARAHRALLLVAGRAVVLVDPMKELS